MYDQNDMEFWFYYITYLFDVYSKAFCLMALAPELFPVISSPMCHNWKLSYSFQMTIWHHNLQGKV